MMTSILGGGIAAKGADPVRPWSAGHPENGPASALAQTSSAMHSANPGAGKSCVILNKTKYLRCHALSTRCPTVRPLTPSRLMR